MARDELSVYEKIEKHLYASTEVAKLSLTPSEIQVKNRLMLCVSKKMNDPMTLDSALVTFLMDGCGGVEDISPISQSQAYRDVAAISKLVGNIQLSSKSWYRYMIVQGALEGYEIAKKEKDAKGMAACLDKIGKYTRADKEDDDMDYSQMIPPNMEPTDDVTVLENMEPIENLEEERHAFRAMFKKDMKSKAVDTQVE